LFLIIFFWTPPHFWALSLFANEDYKRADIPMMTVVAGERAHQNPDADLHAHSPACSRSARISSALKISTI
jgi:hypothetical protein